MESEDNTVQADIARARDMRLKMKKMERRTILLRQKAQLLEQSIFKRCVHEWEKTEDEDVAGFWYNYCPWTCKHCGFFRSGPVKY